MTDKKLNHPKGGTVDVHCGSFFFEGMASNAETTNGEHYRAMITQLFGAQKILLPKRCVFLAGRFDQNNPHVAKPWLPFHIYFQITS